MSPALAIVYAYYEKNAEYRENLVFFLEHGLGGYISSPDVDFFLVINGTCTVPLPSGLANVKVLHRENTGYDFGGYNHAVAAMTRQYDYYMFVNTSCRGPFLPPYAQRNMIWTDAFVQLLQQGDGVKLVGPTINVLELNPSLATVQTFMFAMDAECMALLRGEGFWTGTYGDMGSLIEEKEIGLSRRVLQQGWNISCLIPEYQNRDYRHVRAVFNPDAWSYGGDIMFGGKICFGRAIHPYECMFIKTNRDASNEETASLTRAFSHTARENRP